MGHLRKSRTGSLLALVVLFALGSSARYVDCRQLGKGNDSLPEPTGPYRIGRISFDWVDRSRREVLSKDPTASRELMVHLYYPAAGIRFGEIAPYIPDIERIRDYEQQHFGNNFMRGEYGDSFDALFSTRTNAILDAPMARRPAKFPVLIFQPGLGTKVFFHTAILEDLASHGYVVAAVEPSYETGVVVFPDGRVIEESDEWAVYLGPDPVAAARFHLQRIDVDAANNSYVLDRLQELNRGKTGSVSEMFAGRFDLNRVGVFGHSQGGLAARRSCQLDHRLRACLNLDGGLTEEELDRASSQNIRAPFMLMNGLIGGKILARQIAQFNPVKGPGLFAMVDARAFSHFVYYDFVTPEAVNEAGKRKLDPADRTRDKQIIRAVTLAFFDRYLRRRISALLDGPVPEYPELKLTKFGSAANGLDNHLVRDHSAKRRVPQ